MVIGTRCLKMGSPPQRRTQIPRYTMSKKALTPGDKDTGWLWPRIKLAKLSRDQPIRTNGILG